MGMSQARLGNAQRLLAGEIKRGAPNPTVHACFGTVISGVAGAAADTVAVTLIRC